MKTVIGIYCGNLCSGYWDENVVRNQGCGGSETWAVEIASGFQEMGFHVIIFANPEYDHFADDGVEYVHYSKFEKRCEYQHLDYLIFWRDVSYITPYIECDNIYAIAEDLVLYVEGKFSFNKLKKIGVLSEYQKNYMKRQNPELTDENFFRTFNPIDMSLYENVENVEKKNKMVWSSTQYRSLPYFLEHIFPKIKEAVPDFELDICSYEKAADCNIEGVNILGKLGKKELAQKQMESKIWVYSNEGHYHGSGGGYFQETFCNTAVENAMAKNAILFFNIGGLCSTLEGYDGIIGKEWGNKYENFLHIYDEDLEIYTKKMIDESIRILKDEEYRKCLSDQAYNICKKYNAHNAAMTWVNEWKLNFNK